MTDKILYRVLCDEYEEVARIFFEIKETGEQIEGSHQIQKWINNVFNENKQLKSKLEESKKAHSNCDKLWWELHDEKEQLEKELNRIKNENEQLKAELEFWKKQAKQCPMRSCNE